MMRFAQGLKGTFRKVVKCYVGVFRNAVRSTEFSWMVIRFIAILFVKDVIELQKCDTQSHF